VTEDPTIYLAASYSRLREMQEYRDQLRELGYRVRARWVDGEHEAIDGTATVGEQSIFAQDDVEDVMAADILIHFTTGLPSRGGSHVELGLALMRQKFESTLGQRVMRIVVVGPRQHVFHALPAVIHFDDWADAWKWLSAGRSLDAIAKRSLGR
jgi:hypothetical protein